MILETLIGSAPDTLPAAGKAATLLPGLVDLTAHHVARCDGYARIVAATAPDYAAAARLADLPFLPVSLFKSHLLKSVPDDAVTNLLTTSGTTGPQVSRIAVDAVTADRQARGLASVVAPLLGPTRLPMIVLDNRAVVRDAHHLSARGAGVLGMMRFGRRHFFAFDDDMRLDRDGLRDFLDRFGTQPFLVFGFTFVVWRFFLQALPAGMDLSNGILLHSGGWKRLESEAVDNATFKQQLRERAGLQHVRNFYGMAEQLGGVFLEGEDGFLHPPLFGDVIVRDVDTMEEAEPGRPGLIQVLSLVPTSYPGHSLLTEDIGVVHAVDGGPGGWGGKAFSVLGRARRAPVRGCSDAVDYGSR
ncbi:MAG: acyl-protein synthetase [Telmatospirillum sp.]|nr:acyl-protein synthetase [Telmatospirillum sp.]